MRQVLFILKNNMLIEFCLPIKDEEKILEDSLKNLLNYLESANFSFSWKIIGVVNGSTDSSADIVKTLENKFPEKIKYFEMKAPGRGRALKSYWRLSRADILAYMDADLAVSLGNIKSLIQPLISGEAEVVIGSRLASGAIIERSFLRELTSRGYNIFSQIILGHRISDLQCGFKALNRRVFTKLDQYLIDDYWFFDTELIILAKKFNYFIKEVPVNWQENRLGARKSTVKIVRDSWRFVVRSLSFRRRLRQIMKHRGNELIPPAH